LGTASVFELFITVFFFKKVKFLLAVIVLFVWFGYTKTINKTKTNGRTPGPVFLPSMTLLVVTVYWYKPAFGANSLREVQQLPQASNITPRRGRVGR
jgi:hypothetical protein